MPERPTAYRPDPEGTHPPLDWPGYRSTALRAPSRAFDVFPATLTEVTGPLLGEGRVGEHDHDLTRQHDEEPQGQRIVVHGRVLDGDGRADPATLVEIWQANAARPLPPPDRPAPRAAGPELHRRRTLPDRRRRALRVHHHQAGRLSVGQPPERVAARAHPLLAVRARVPQRLVTQMYFPGDPLFPYDPIFNSVRDERARDRLVCAFDLETTVPDWALAYRWDIVLRGPDATPPDA